MDKDERKPRLHVHLGGLVIFIIIILILFKIDIKSKIESPQFQNNYAYIEGQVKNIWQNYIIKPLKDKTIDTFFDFTNKKFEEIQNDFKEDVLKKDYDIDIESLQ